MEPTPRIAPRRSGPLRTPSSAAITQPEAAVVGEVESRRSQRSAGVVGSAPMSRVQRASQRRGFEGTRTDA